MISIIVPIYKIEKYINQCVDSILSQTYKNIEIILVDDGSPDHCPEICDAYAKQDSRVKVVHKENGGLMSARQAGLKAAAGEYIGFVDGDDWIEPDMYASFAEAIDTYNPDMALCEFIFEYDDNKEYSAQNLKKPFFTKEEMKAELYPTMLFRNVYYQFGINPCCWSKIYKKEILEKCLYNVTTDIKMGEDAAFTYPCLIEAESVAYVNKFSYHYRSNPDSITNSYDINLENTILIPYDILKHAFENSEYNFSNSLDYYLLYLVNFVIRNEASPANKKARKDIVKTLKKFINNEDVQRSVRAIDYAPLPLHTKCIALFLRFKSTHLLYLYTLLLKNFL